MSSLMPKMTYLGDSGDHVGDERLDGGHSGGLSVESIPHLDSAVATSLLSSGELDNSDIERDVTEILGN